MKKISINYLLKHLGKTLTSYEVENFLHSLGVKRRPYLSHEEIDEGVYNQWLPIKKLGLEMEFKSQAIFESCNEDKVTGAHLVLTTFIFYGDAEGIKPYAYDLPYALDFTDTPESARKKMSTTKGLHKEYIRDVWIFDTHKLIVTYNEKRDTVSNIIYMLNSPYESTEAIPMDLNTLIAHFGKSYRSKEIKEVFSFFDLDDFTGEQRQVTPHTMIKNYGFYPLFTKVENISEDKLFVGFSLYAKCSLNFSHGYTGNLPFGLTFEDSPYDIADKFSEKPAETFEHEARMEGEITWLFESFSFQIVYSLLVNNIARVQIFSNIVLSDEDRENMEIDKKSLLYKRILNKL